jgi:uncharacterized protein (UPF0305 family)
MKTIEIRLEESYIDSVMEILKSLRKDMIKEILVKNSSDEMLDSHKEELFRRARKYQDIDKSQLMGLDIRVKPSQ